LGLSHRGTGNSILALREWFWRWTPVILWMAVIFYLSSIPSPAQVELPFWDELGSYLGHFAEYTILALLLTRAQARPPASLTRGFLVSFLVALAYAFSDEFHQRFVPNRTSSLVDVAVDAAGVAFALGLVWLLAAVRRR